MTEKEHFIPSEGIRSETKEDLGLNEEDKEIFQRMQGNMEEAYGIKLSNIELVGLKKITKKVMKDYYRSKDSGGAYDEIVPKLEIEERFLRAFYDMTVNDFYQFFRDENNEISKDKIKTYFRKKQEEQHLI